MHYTHYSRHIPYKLHVNKLHVVKIFAPYNLQTNQSTKTYVAMISQSYTKE